LGHLRSLAYDSMPSQEEGTYEVPISTSLTGILSGSLESCPGTFEDISTIESA
jgi:hypothetical protein